MSPDTLNDFLLDGGLVYRRLIGESAERGREDDPLQTRYEKMTEYDVIFN